MGNLKLTRCRIRTGDRVSGPDRPFTAILLADLHEKEYGDGNRQLLQMIREQDAELILIAGDLLTVGRDCLMEHSLHLLDELTRRYPVYYVAGNHEQRLKWHPDRYPGKYELFAEQVRSCGVHLLENTCEQLSIHHTKLNIFGLELPVECYLRGRQGELTAQKIRDLIGPAPEDGYNILLSHHPAYFRSYAEWGADLTLCGHYHGGIVRLPFFGGVISPQLRLFPKYTRGLYREGDSRMIVSAGTGSHTINVRINNPAELVAIDFL